MNANVVMTCAWRQSAFDPPCYSSSDMAPDAPFVRQLAESCAAETGTPPTVYFRPHGGRFQEAGG